MIDYDKLADRMGYELDDVPEDEHDEVVDTLAILEGVLAHHGPYENPDRYEGRTSPWA